MQKIIEVFNKLNDKLRYGILIGLVILIIAADVYFLALTQWASMAKMDDQIKQLSSDTKQVLTDRQRINQLKKNLDDSKAQLDLLSTKIRLVQEVPVILSNISSIANEYGVKIDELVPEKNQQETLKTSSKDSKYYSLPIVIKARCGYHPFGRFLDKLEKQNVSFIIKDFIVQHVEKDPNNHLFTMTIKIVLTDKH